MGISCACWHLQLGWKILFRMRKPANQLSGTGLCETVFTSHLCCTMTFKCAPASTGDAQWRLNPFLHFPPKNKWKKKQNKTIFCLQLKTDFLITFLCFVTAFAFRIICFLFFSSSLSFVSSKIEIGQFVFASIQFAILNEKKIFEAIGE